MNLQASKLYWQTKNDKYQVCWCLGGIVNEMSLATNKSDLWGSTLSSLRECADSKKEALFYLARFLKWLEVSLRNCLYFILPASISKICIIDIYVKQISSMLTWQHYCATLLRRNKSSLERRSEKLPNWGPPFHSFIWIWFVFLFICHDDNICGAPVAITMTTVVIRENPQLGPTLPLLIKEHKREDMWEKQGNQEVRML